MFRKNLLYLAVVLIGGLLLTDILLTNYNNSTMKQNRAVQNEISIIRSYYDQIGKVVIHSLDIGLRGFALVPEPSFSKPMYNALAWKDSIFNNVELPLTKLGYKGEELKVLRDSVDAYTEYCFMLKGLLETHDTATFKRFFRTDKGATLWGQYIVGEAGIDRFLDTIGEDARLAIEAAMTRNQVLQVVLFIICFPTLVYTAFYTIKTNNLTEQLRIMEADKNKMLREQNEVLERNVAERTQEIMAQNEEIISQTEELATQRDTLFLQHKEVQEAHKLIGIQNQEIQFRNETLQKEIIKQTQELRNANQELIAHNNQLEQFAFIAAHNLRAPLARILGLANIIKISDLEKDRNDAMGKIVSSALDLDAVVKDLSTILDIKKHTSNFSAVDLNASLARVMKTLEKEIEDTDTKLNVDLSETPTIYGVAPYVESILYNLISNAIKYRSPDRKPLIKVWGIDLADHTIITVTDNGLGIDMSKHGESVFNLYKRFHLHVEGKGLGLFLVKAQMTSMGGRVEIDSELDKGTTFRLHFKKP